MTNYKPGDVIFTSEPYVQVLSQKERAKRCDACFKIEEGCLRCSACKVVRYCSVTCQRAAWNVHKWECKCFARIAPNVPTESVRLFLRILIKIKKCDGLKDAETILGRKRNFDSLMSHVQEIQGDQKRLANLMEFAQTLKTFSDDLIEDITPATLLEYFGKVVINSFSILDDDMKPIGVGLYLGASILDHSCSPNAVIAFTGTNVQVRCIKAISETDTEEIPTISYINQLATREHRQSDLSSQYYFLCKCPRCMDGKKDLEMLSSKCPQDHCDGSVWEETGLLACNQCKRTEFSEAYKLKRTTSMEELRSAVESLKEQQKQLADLSESQEFLKQCELEITGGRKILPNTNIYIVELYNLAFDECIQLKLWDKAVEYGSVVLPGLRKYYSTNHPMLGHHLLKMGKILLYQKKLAEALKHLHQAEDILGITHGKDHSLSITLGDLLTECTEELRGQLSS